MLQTICEYKCIWKAPHGVNYHNSLPILFLNAPFKKKCRLYISFGTPPRERFGFCSALCSLALGRPGLPALGLSGCSAHVLLHCSTVFLSISSISLALLATGKPWESCGIQMTWNEIKFIQLQQQCSAFTQVDTRYGLQSSDASRQLVGNLGFPSPLHGPRSPPAPNGLDLGGRMGFESVSLLPLGPQGAGGSQPATLASGKGTGTESAWCGEQWGPGCMNGLSSCVAQFKFFFFKKKVIVDVIKDFCVSSTIQIW